MSKTATKPEYCPNCFAELTSNGDCRDCEDHDTHAFRLLMDKSIPGYSKMFSPKNEGITWERVPSRYKQC